MSIIRFGTGGFVWAAIFLCGCSVSQVNPGSGSPASAAALAAFDIPRLDSIQIDGKPDDWGDRGFRVEAISSPTGSEVPASEFNARFRIGWDDRGLLILSTVHNTAPAETPGIAEMWRGDALEFFFSKGPGSRDSWQAVISPGADSVQQQLRIHITDGRKDPSLKGTPIELIARRMKVEDGYVMETLLPWKSLGVTPHVGQTVGLQIGADAARHATAGDGGQLRLTWFPALDSYSNTKHVYALTLSDHAFPPVTLAVSSRPVQSRHLQVNVITGAELAGKQIKVMAPDGAVQTAFAGGANQPSVTTLQLPLPPPESYGVITNSAPPAKWAGENVIVSVGGQQIAVAAYKDLSMTRAMDFLREKLTAHNYVFSDKTFPAIAFDRPSEAEDEIGSFHLNTTFYDADFKPVKTADRPGRYGAVVEVVTRAGVVNRRYQTLYRAPGNVDWRTAFLGARVGLARAIGVDDGIAWEQTLASSEVYRRVLANSLTTEDSLAVLFCALAETHAGDVGARYQNVSRRNDAWWVGLKKSIGQFQPYQYVIHLPPGYSANGGKHWPLILFLHGSDPHSDTLDLIRTQGLCAYAIAHRELPFVVISPATPPGTRISTATLTTLLDDVMQQYDVDPDRVYVTGLSLGGFGTWDLAAQTPERFAAAVPIAGFGDPNDALRLKNLPMWVFHGDADPTVPIGEDERSVAALQTVGGRVKFTVYAGVVHDSWTRTYANPELYRWLLQQRRGAPTQAPATQPTTAPTTRSVPW